MKLRFKICQSVSTFLFFGVAPASQAAEGGVSHYTPALYGDFSAAVAPDPGFYFRQDLYQYSAGSSGRRFVQNGEIRSELDVDASLYMLTGLWALEKEVFGAKFAWGGFIPLVYTDVSASVGLGATSRTFSEDGWNLADPGIVPASFFWSCENWNFNLYETVSIPIGEYDKDNDINGGLNYWSFETTFATTYLNSDSGFEFSMVLGHIYNTENNDTNYQSGQELHLELMLNQYLSETFALGIHGFAYRQITGDSGSGALLGEFEGEANGIGPSLMWVTKIGNCPTIVTARWLHEFGAENRLEGDHFYLSATIPF